MSQTEHLLYYSQLISKHGSHIQIMLWSKMFLAAIEIIFCFRATAAEAWSALGMDNTLFTASPVSLAICVP